MNKQKRDELRAFYEKRGHQTEILELIDALDRCEEALGGLFALIEEERLVRNTDNDSSASFIVGAMDFVEKLKTASDALTALRGEK